MCYIKNYARLLIVINPSDDAVDNYSLNLAEGPLSGPVDVSLLLGEGALTAPQVNAGGGFDDYLPLESLPPYSTVVIELTN